MDQDKFQELELTPEEQNEFKGGMFCADFIEDDGGGGGHIRNINRYSACRCDYKNHSMIENLNEVWGCNCVCTF